jgi:hypothetical protein
MVQYISYLQISRKPVSFRREVLYNILIEFGIPRKLVGLIKMCLNETYSRIRIGKNMSDKCTVQNGLKQDVYRHFFSTLFWSVQLGGSKRNRKD